MKFWQSLFVVAYHCSSELKRDILSSQHCVTAHHERTHMHACTYARTYAHTHALMHTHAHTQVYKWTKEMHALPLLAVWDLKSKHYGVCQGYLYSRWTKTNHWGTELPCVLQRPVFTSIFPLFSWVANHRSSTTLQVWSCQLPPRVRAGCHGSHNWRSAVDWQKKKTCQQLPCCRERERENPLPRLALHEAWASSSEAPHAV